MYRCIRCDVTKYEGEKSKVVKHIYRKHVALDSVPFYCNICKFVTTAQAELEKHMDTSVYPTHAATVNAMLASGQEVSENDSLLNNEKFHVIGDEDMVRLSRDESTAIFSERKQVKSASMSDTNDILRTVMMTAKIPVVNKSLRTPSVETENILPQLLGETTLSPAIVDLNKSAPNMWAPMKGNGEIPVAKSDSTPSSSSSSNSSSNRLEKEVVELRKATRTMATAMESLIQEVNGMRKEMTAWQ